nr:uncharacterized protein LOC106731428 [Pelodiscus sinensis]|eukprot:XP_014424937.1 uncharacterized protein LOC106731428 [Pelodiscus sinensis]
MPSLKQILEDQAPECQSLDCTSSVDTIIPAMKELYANIAVSVWEWLKLFWRTPFYWNCPRPPWPPYILIRRGNNPALYPLPDQEAVRDIPAALLEKEERVQRSLKKTKKAAFKSNNTETGAPDLEQPSTSKAGFRQSEPGVKRVGGVAPGVGGKRCKGDSPKQPVSGKPADAQKKVFVNGDNNKKPKSRDLKDLSQCVMELYDLSIRFRSIHEFMRELTEKKFPRLAFEVMQKQYYVGEFGNLARKLLATRREVEIMENWMQGGGLE